MRLPPKAFSTQLERRAQIYEKAAFSLTRKYSEKSSVAYTLIYSETALRDIKKLDPVVKKRIGKRLLTLESNPFSNSKKLTNFKPEVYRFRIGDYRAIFEVVKNKIYVLSIRHRSEIYK